MRRGVTDILSQGDEPRGQGAGTDRTGAGIWDERVPIVLCQALWVGGVRLRRQQQ